MKKDLILSATLRVKSIVSKTAVLTRDLETVIGDELRVEFNILSPKKIKVKNLRTGIEKITWLSRIKTCFEALTYEIENDDINL